MCVYSIHRSQGERRFPRVCGCSSLMTLPVSGLDRWRVQHDLHNVRSLNTERFVVFASSEKKLPSVMSLPFLLDSFLYIHLAISADFTL